MSKDCKELISVIIPVYNTEKFVKECVESVLHQDYENLEIIIINDGSTDSSASICDTLVADKRVQVIHQQNIGLGNTRQKGIDICKGKYFVTIDSDDYIANDFISQLYDSIKLNNSDIAVCGRYDFVDGKDIMRENLLSIGETKMDITKELLENNLRELGRKLALSDSWNKMYNTNFIRETNVRFELPNKYNGTDLAYNYKVAMHAPTYSIVNKPLLFHRIVEGSRVHRKNKPLQEGFEVIIDQLFDEGKRTGLELKRQLGNLYYVFLSLVFIDLSTYTTPLVERKKAINAFLVRHRDFNSVKKLKYCGCEKNMNRFTKVAINNIQSGNAFVLWLLSLLYSFIHSLHNK